MHFNLINIILLGNFLFALYRRILVVLILCDSCHCDIRTVFHIKKVTRRRNWVRGLWYISNWECWWHWNISHWHITEWHTFAEMFWMSPVYLIVPRRVSEPVVSVWSWRGVGVPGSGEILRERASECGVVSRKILSQYAVDTPEPRHQAPRPRVITTQYHCSSLDTFYLVRSHLLFLLFLPTNWLTKCEGRVNTTLHICWVSAGVGPCQRLLREIRKVYNLQVLMSILGIASREHSSVPGSWLRVLPAIFQICHATLRQAIVQLWWFLILQGTHWCQRRRKVVVTSVLLL